MKMKCAPNMRRIDLIFTLFIICFTGTTYCDTFPDCDNGWVLFNNTCYLVNNTKSISKYAADAECALFDSSLLRIDAKEQMDFVVSLMESAPSSGYWTSLNDIPSNILQINGTGIWKWGQFDLAYLDLIQWNQSPTNDDQSNCAGINTQGDMEDRNCGSKQQFICKKREAADQGCPLGWNIGPVGCFYISLHRKTWEEAKAFCGNKNSQLLVIKDQNDVAFVREESPYLPKTTAVYWTGLHSTGSGNWGWYTRDAFTPSLIRWQSEPNNLAGMENCGVLRMNGKFSDRNCSSDASFICNKPKYSYDDNKDNGCGHWMRAGKSCYGFITGQHEGTWPVARQYCQSMGADLIKVDTFDKKIWLELQLMDPANDRLFWTGLNDRQSKGTYVWADGVPIDNTLIKWNQEPNNYNGNEDCALITSIAVYNDVPCITKAAAICEIATTDPCQVGWKRFQQSCYLFTPFTDTSLLYNQIEASAYCQAAGGRLLSVDDRHEKIFIKTAITNQIHENIYGWWTSLNDKEYEGLWSFENNLVPDPKLIDWAGEPSTKGGDDCGIVTFAGHYYMRNCNSKTAFICEKAATGSSKDSKAGNESNGTNSTN